MDVYPSSLDPKVPGGLSPVTRGRNLLDRALWIPTPLLFHFCFSLVVFFCGHLSNKCPHPRVCFWRKQLRQPGRISKMFMHAQLPRSCLTLCDPIDCNLPASLSMEFSRQEYWSASSCESKLCHNIERPFLRLHRLGKSMLPNTPPSSTGAPPQEIMKVVA